MKKALLLLIFTATLLFASGCGLLSEDFALGSVQTFCPSPHGDSSDYPLYSALGSSDSIINTDFGTYIIQSDGRWRNSSGGSAMPEDYLVMKLGKEDPQIVFRGKTCGVMPRLCLCSNQKGKLVAVSPEEHGMVFGIYCENSGEFTQVKLRKEGYAVRNYILGIDPYAGKEGIVYLIMSQQGVDKNTLIFSLDIASRSVTEQEFCSTPYPMSPGFMLFENPGQAHVVFESEGKILHMAVSSPGTAEQKVSEPLVIQEDALANSGYFDAVADGDGRLHVFCAGNDEKIYHTVLENRVTVFSGVALSGIIPVACFADTFGEVFLVSMQTTEQQYNQCFEATVFKINGDGSLSEAATVFSDDVPGSKSYFNVTNTRLGGKTDKGTFIFYLSTEKDQFVTAELEKTH